MTEEPAQEEPAKATRLDRVLVDRGLTSSRTRARRLIEAGQVEVAGRRVCKPATLIAPSCPVTVTGTGPGTGEGAEDWASRGALKLIQALDLFAIDPAGARCLDIGASSGGFTDVLLRHRAASVVAVDVGHGQLIPRLAADPRVTHLERTDARTLTAERVGGPVDLLVADVSFISLTKALAGACALVRGGGRLAVLVKPQFEAGPGKVGKGGILRDPDVRRAALEEVTHWFAAAGCWHGISSAPADLPGGGGNQEYLLSAWRDMSPPSQGGGLAE